MKSTHVAVVFFCVFTASLWRLDHQASASPPVALYPERREIAQPAGGQLVGRNPPPLLWPVTSGKATRYAVQLCRDPEFPAISSIEASPFRWAMFNPHTKLAAGRWYWRYAVVRRAGAGARWSEAFNFSVDETARVFETPPAPQMIAAVPKGHPRLLATPEELPDLRKRLKNSPETAYFVRRADRYLGGKLPEAPRGTPEDGGSNAAEARQFAKWASKGYAGQLREAISWLTPAYLLTGDARYGREAIRRALHIAALDPDGVTSPKVSDFADGSCMRAMALAYDSCYDLFETEEKVRLREAMLVRAQRFFDRQVNNLEARVFSAHVWQHILAEFAEVAFATLGEASEAELWASTCTSCGLLASLCSGATTAVGPTD